MTAFFAKNKAEHPAAFPAPAFPVPQDTSGVALSPDLLALREELAENTHNVWAGQRLAEGWRWGNCRNDAAKEHPGLVPYAHLPDAEKDYDRRTAMETLRLIVALGYRITKEPEAQ